MLQETPLGTVLVVYFFFLFIPLYFRLMSYKTIVSMYIPNVYTKDFPYNICYSLSELSLTSKL